MNPAFDLDSLAAQHAEQRFEWIHPSWRDVVIEHLMRHPADRRRFLSRCAVAGLELALSISGGHAGERRLPLLVSADDWTALRVRAAQLIPTLSALEQEQLLGAAQGLSTNVGTDVVAREQANRLQGELLQALAGDWDARAVPIRERSLWLFFETSVEASPLVGAPQLQISLESHTEVLGADTTGLTPASIQDALAFVQTVARNEPRALRQFGWPERFGQRFPALAAAAQGVRDSAALGVQQIQDGDFVDYDEATEWSTDTFMWRRVLETLRELGVRDEAALERELRTAEVAVDDWLQAEEERAAERQEMVEDAEDTDDDSPDPSELFSVDAIFADL